MSRQSSATTDGDAGVSSVRVHYYEQFDADAYADRPCRSLGGWREGEVDLALDRVAIVSMHVWSCGTAEQYPGWYRAVEYLGRCERSVREGVAPLLQLARIRGWPVIHAAGGGDYYRSHPGHAAVAKAIPEQPAATGEIYAAADAQRLHRVRSDRSIGAHNRDDMQRGLQSVDFHALARPIDGEDVVATTEQLHWVCRQRRVNHLIYAGFAINACLLASPCGMIDMARLGYVCSAVPEAVTAVENRETTEDELAKQLALWRVSCAFGFVIPLQSLGAVRNG